MWGRPPGPSSRAKLGSTLQRSMPRGERKANILIDDTQRYRPATHPLVDRRAVRRLLVRWRRYANKRIVSGLPTIHELTGLWRCESWGCYVNTLGKGCQRCDERCSILLGQEEMQRIKSASRERLMMKRYRRQLPATTLGFAIRGKKTGPLVRPR